MCRLITIATFILLTFQSCKNYVEYQPLVFDGDDIVVKPDLLTNEHKTNFIQVLKYYGQDWKEENGKIYISSKIDREILWNYTTKADDPEWLRTHNDTCRGEIKNP